jgi:hypothetical protein
MSPVRHKRPLLARRGPPQSPASCQNPVRSFGRSATQVVIAGHEMLAGMYASGAPSDVPKNIYHVGFDFRRSETMPSTPSLHACLNTSPPPAAMCSLKGCRSRCRVAPPSEPAASARACRGDRYTSRPMDMARFQRSTAPSASTRGVAGAMPGSQHGIASDMTRHVASDMCERAAGAVHVPLCAGLRLRGCFCCRRCALRCFAGLRGFSR